MRLPVLVITPWRDHLELIPDYERAVRGAHVIIVDNASLEQSRAELEALALRLGGSYLRSDTPMPYGQACNAGLMLASAERKVDYAIVLNNDIRATGRWLHAALADMRSGEAGLYGPEMQAQVVDGAVIPFLSGWCIGAPLAVWERLAGFDDREFTGNYWEDNDLCFRAVCHGFKLHRRDWPIVHLRGITANSTPGAYDGVAANRAAFERRVREWAARESAAADEGGNDEGSLCDLGEKTAAGAGVPAG